jgi:hypothetical protein
VYYFNLFDQRNCGEHRTRGIQVPISLRWSIG